MTLARLLVALAVVATVTFAAADPIMEAGNRAIVELNRIGAAERTRQEQIRKVACEAFPEDCPSPVTAWVDAPLLTGPPTTGTAP